MFKERGQDFFPEMDIKKADVPCWYEISWNSETKGLQFKIHSGVIRKIKKIDSSELNFCTDFTKDIGIENVFKNKGIDKNNMFVYEAKINCIRKLTNQKCASCHGEDDFENCLWCGGTGKVSIYNRKNIYPLLASLSLLTRLFYSAKKNIVSSNLCQLLTLSATVDLSPDSGSFSGEISQKLYRYVKNQTQDFLSQKVTRAMIEATETMFGKNSIESKDGELGIFKKKINGTVSFGCMGVNSCGIGTDENSYQDIEQGFGYNFSSHNVNNIEQQMVLIVGLAALNDTARKEESKMTNNI